MGIRGVEERRRTSLASKISEQIATFEIDEFEFSSIDELENVSPYDFLD